MKQCPKCGDNKPIGCFSKNEKHCKNCVSLIAKKLVADGYYARYYQKHKTRINQREIKKRQENIHFRIKCRLRTRMANALNGKAKAYKTQELLGCSIPQLKTYLEAQFQPGMTWANYGDWHIDHRLPCASFDLSNPEHQRVCFHHSNLQPLWAAENIAKSDNILK